MEFIVLPFYNAMFNARSVRIAAWQVGWTTCCRFILKPEAVGFTRIFRSHAIAFSHFPIFFFFNV